MRIVSYKAKHGANFEDPRGFEATVECCEVLESNGMNVGLLTPYESSIYSVHSVE